MMRLLGVLGTGARESACSIGERRFFINLSTIGRKMTAFVYQDSSISSTFQFPPMHQAHPHSKNPLRIETWAERTIRQH